jgi:demethylmenaquinone methyltransferase/2-methoxy-6-polyprenyl-1,4-benzoquinol methylase
MSTITNIPNENKSLQTKYRVTSLFYDILDYPWEKQYRKWRPGLLKDVYGEVIEAGVGTGRNLQYYPHNAKVTGIDLSEDMLKISAKRGSFAECDFYPVHEDATSLESIPSNNFDWLVSTFLCCVMPDHLQPLAIDQFERVLKPGAHFRILEMVYSKNSKLRRKQQLFAPFIQWVYGARFDRNTLEYLENSSILKITKTYFLKEDIYLVIEGECRK